MDHVNDLTSDSSKAASASGNIIVLFSFYLLLLLLLVVSRLLRHIYSKRFWNIRSLPVMTFHAKDYFKDGQQLECAVCLNEVCNGEKVRLLPKCNHGFHVGCIDMWLQSNSTCPLCRTMAISPDVTQHHSSYGGGRGRGIFSDFIVFLFENISKKTINPLSLEITSAFCENFKFPIY